ncbi:MAG: flagellar biosynthesis anti-sigma factor FlgM [Bacillota bacterium]
MKINNYGSIPDIMKAYNSQRKDRANSGKDAPVAGEKDTLELSEQARELQEIKSGLKDLSDVREEKVERLKREISSGSYRVDAGKIAEEMMRERLLDKQV